MVMVLLCQKQIENGYSTVMPETEENGYSTAMMDKDEIAIVLLRPVQIK